MPVKSSFCQFYIHCKSASFKKTVVAGIRFRQPTYVKLSDVS